MRTPREPFLPDLLILLTSKYLLAAFSILFGFTSVLQAAVPEVELQVTATTPSRIEQPLDEVSGSISVITETTLEIKRPVSLSEALRDIPSVNLRQAGSIGEQATVRIRGAEPNQSLILLDGLRVNTPFRGFFDFGNFMMDNIGQIEVVRGAQSALYGSEAMGGVVNLKTRSARLEREIFVFAQGGNFETLHEGLGLGTKRNWGNGTFTASRIDSKGDLDRDRYGGTVVSGRLQLNLSSKDLLIMIPRYQVDHKELAVTPVEVSIPLPLIEDVNNEIDRSFFSNLLEFRHTVRSGWNLILRGGIVQSSIDWDNPIDPGEAFGYFLSEDGMDQEYSVNLQQDITWKDRHIFTLGAEYLHDDVENDFSIGFMGLSFDDQIETTRQNRAIYAQQLFHWDKEVILQLGIRMDDNSSFGRIIAPKVSAVYQAPAWGPRLRASWGKAFRNPTIQELQSPFFGNPNLDPEESQNWEAGMAQGFWGDHVIIDLAYFQINFEELIERTPTGANNIGKAKLKGIETGVLLKPSRMWQLGGNYAFISSRKDETGERLAFRPHNRFNFNLQVNPMINLMFNLDVNVTSSQHIPIDFILTDGSLLQNKSPGYERVDFEISYEALKGFWIIRNSRLFLRLNNLFDQEFQEIPGFPAPSRHFLAGLKAYL